jgi:hypothetical protein
VREERGRGREMVQMEEEEGGFRKKITIGVCVMEKKVKCGSEVLSFFSIYLSNNTKQSVH